MTVNEAYAEKVRGALEAQATALARRLKLPLTVSVQRDGEDVTLTVTGTDAAGVRAMAAHLRGLAYRLRLPADVTPDETTGQLTLTTTATVTATTAAGGPPAATQALFADDFETGGLSAWGGPNAGASVDGTYAIDGSYGLGFPGGGSVRHQFQSSDNHPALSMQCRVVAPLGTLFPCEFYDPTGTYPLARALAFPGTGIIRLYVYALDTSGNGGFVDVEGQLAEWDFTPFTLELVDYRSGAQRTVYLYRDGLEIASLPDTWTATPNPVVYPARIGVTSNSSNSHWVDTISLKDGYQGA